MRMLFGGKKGKKKSRNDIIKMVITYVPDFSPRHRKTDYQLSINKPNCESQNLGVSLKHPWTTET